MLGGSDPFRAFYYGHVLSKVFDRVAVISLTLTSQGQNYDQKALSEIVATAFSLAASALVFVNCVRFIFFREYVFMEAAVQLVVVACEKFDLKPVKGVLAILEGSQDFLQSQPFAYVHPIVINLLVNLGACFFPELRGLSKLLSFICELAISGINTAELQRTLLDQKPWSDPMLVVCQVVGVALLEFASWDPWSALLGFGPSDDNPIPAALYCLCGFAGLATFYWAQGQDSKEAEQAKTARMEKNKTYEKLAQCYVNVAKELPSAQAACGDAPATAHSSASNASDAPDYRKLLIFAAKCAAPSFGAMGAALSLAWDMRGVCAGAAEAIRAMTTGKGATCCPNDVLANNTVNLVAFAVRHPEWFRHGELAARLFFVVFLWAYGFADELCKIWSELPLQYKQLFILAVSGLLSVCFLLKGTEYMAEESAASTQGQPLDNSWVADGDASFCILAGTGSKPDLYLTGPAIVGNSDLEPPRPSLQAAPDVGGVPQGSAWRLCDKDGGTSIQHRDSGMYLVMQGGSPALSKEEPEAGGLWHKGPWEGEGEALEGLASSAAGGGAGAGSMDGRDEPPRPQPADPQPEAQSMVDVLSAAAFFITGLGHMRQLVYSGAAVFIPSTSDKAPNPRRSWVTLTNKDGERLKLPRVSASTAGDGAAADISAWRMVST